MATIVFPNAMMKAVASSDYGIQFDVQITTTRSGKIWTYGLPGARWTASIAFHDDTEIGLRPALEALIVQLEGGSGRLQMGHLGRPLPNGTLRGSPILNGAHAAGVKALNLGSCNGTLKAGDIIGLPNQLLMVCADTAAPSGGLLNSVAIRPALFTAYATSTAVTVDHPTTLWIPKSTLAGPFPFRAARIRPGFTLDLVETSS